MSKTKFTATLVLHVTYELDPMSSPEDTSEYRRCRDLVENLRSIPDKLAASGQLTDSIDASVDIYSSEVLAHVQ